MNPTLTIPLENKEEIMLVAVPKDASLFSYRIKWHGKTAYSIQLDGKSIFTFASKSAPKFLGALTQQGIDFEASKEWFFKIPAFDSASDLQKFNEGKSVINYNAMLLSLCLSHIGKAVFMIENPFGEEPKKYEKKYQTNRGKSAFKECYKTWNNAEFKVVRKWIVILKK